jgi:4'-phosphopantetheinyl transferase
MIVIKYCDIDIIDDGCISQYLDLLPAFMSREILRYKYAADQKARLLSRLMLRESIADTGVADCLKDWKRDVSNKPVIDNWNAFNISHASNLVVFAYTTGQSIGIDIEKRKDLEYNEIIENFHAEEQQLIRSAADPKTCFYKTWVKKEALLKAAGIGIVNGLSDFSCVEDLVNYRKQTWYLKEVHVHSEYECYLCSLNISEQVIIEEFSIK